MRAVMAVVLATVLIQAGSASASDLTSLLSCQTGGRVFTELLRPPYKSLFRFQRQMSAEVCTIDDATPRAPLALFGAKVVFVHVENGDCVDSLVMLSGQLDAIVPAAAAAYGPGAQQVAAPAAAAPDFTRAVRFHRTDVGDVTVLFGQRPDGQVAMSCPAA